MSVSAWPLAVLLTSSPASTPPTIPAALPASTSADSQPQSKVSAEASQPEVVSELPAPTLTTNTLRALDDRVESDERFRKYREQSLNLYETTRNAYHVKRQAEIDELRAKRPKKAK